jgi:F-box/leucine-rich repeat protein 10/11
LTNGPSAYKRSSGRKRIKVDYKALDEGDVDEALMKEHPHIESFKQWESHNTVDELKGEELTVEYALRTRLPRPVKISNENRGGLGLIIPKFDVDDLVESMGDEHHIEVMDVLTQNSARQKWSLGEWRDYFKSDDSSRERVYNVLSLEISQSSLGESISRPTYVDEIDLVDKVWPQELTGKPIVQKYCLMGVKGSYTDFHLDFAGTSVYYTVIYGEKQFMFFPPTEHNLKKYVQWITTTHLTQQFLGNLGLKDGIKVILKPGDVMIIPSGWIHAVYTPIDTLVIGGNFLTSFNLTEQLKIIDIELRTKVGKKFKFPNFSKLMFLTAWKVVEGELIIGKDIDIQGIRELCEYLKACLAVKEGREAVPVKIVGNAKSLVKRLEEVIGVEVKVEVKIEKRPMEEDQKCNKRMKQ